MNWLTMLSTMATFSSVLLSSASAFFLRLVSSCSKFFNSIMESLSWDSLSMSMSMVSAKDSPLSTNSSEKETGPRVFFPKILIDEN